MESSSGTTLDYEPLQARGLRIRDPAKRRLGVASCTCWGISVAFVGLGCFVAAARSPMDSSDGAWVSGVLLIAWVASIFGTFVGMLGALPLERRGEFAVTGFLLNLVTCLCPLGLCVLSGGLPC
jgi:hypothetical protein